MEVRKRERRQQIRERLIAERLKNAEMFRGRSVLLGADLSKSTDLTVINNTVIDTREQGALAQYWKNKYPKLEQYFENESERRN